MLRIIAQWINGSFLAIVILSLLGIILILCTALLKKEKALRLEQLKIGTTGVFLTYELNKDAAFNVLLEENAKLKEENEFLKHRNILYTGLAMMIACAVYVIFFWRRIKKVFSKENLEKYPLPESLENVPSEKSNSEN